MRFSLVLLTIRRILWDILQGSHKITRRPCDIRSIANEVSLRNIKMFGVHLVLSYTEERKAIVNNGKCLSQSSLWSLTNIANICCKVLLKRSIIPSGLGWMGVFLYFFHFIRLKKNDSNSRPWSVWILEGEPYLHLNSHTNLSTTVYAVWSGRVYASVHFVK